VDTADNRRLHEGHMREAQLEAHQDAATGRTTTAAAATTPATNTTTDRATATTVTTTLAAAGRGDHHHHYWFRKRRLLESTSMVHTPIADVAAAGIPHVDCSK
jgi:hypothetical protein